MKEAVKRLERDFPDWLNPVLVKELRQGLRSRVFLISFAAIQIFLSLYLVMSGVVYESMLSRNMEVSLDFMDWVFWFFLGTPLLVLLPMRGSSVIGDENEGRKLDLLRLSRLGHVRLVLGKWVAVIAISVLLVAAVLPYLIARYFLGFNSVQDISLLSVYCLLSFLFSALAVGYSGMHAGLRRMLILLLVFGALVLPPFTMPFLVNTTIFYSVAGSSRIIGLMLLLASAVVLASYWLLFGMWQVSYKTGWLYLWKRIFVLFLAVLFLGFTSLGNIGVVWACVVALVLYAALLDVFSESPVAGTSHAGVVGRVPAFFRVLARSLYPGWMWGALFFAVVVFLVAAGVFVTLELTKSSLQQELRDYLQTLLNTTLAMWFSFIFGALLGNVIFRKALPPALTIFLYQSLTLVMGVLFLNMVEKTVVHQSLWWLSAVFFPPAVVFYPWIDSTAYSSLGLAPAIVMGFCGFFLLTALHFIVCRERERLKHLEKITCVPAGGNSLRELQKVQLR